MAFTLQDVASAAAKQSDPSVVREGSPAYLMLIDGLLQSYPQNKELLLSASRAYSSYASLIQDENEEEATRLYHKAMLYGFRALSGKTDFQKTARGPLEEFRKALEGFGKKDVPALFWTANAWASWIANDLDNVEAVADLPMLEATMKRILELDDAYYYGGPHLLMAVYLAAKPKVLGGNLEEAERHFQRAFALGSDKILGAKVMYAEYYARGIKDRNLYVDTLESVLNAPSDEPPEFTLANVMAQDRARKLLEKTEEYFAEQP